MDSHNEDYRHCAMEMFSPSMAMIQYLWRV